MGDGGDGEVVWEGDVGDKVTLGRRDGLRFRGYPPDKYPPALDGGYEEGADDEHVGDLARGGPRGCLAHQAEDDQARRRRWGDESVVVYGGDDGGGCAVGEGRRRTDEAEGHVVEMEGAGVRDGRCEEVCHTALVDGRRSAVGGAAIGNEAQGPVGCVKRGFFGRHFGGQGGRAVSVSQDRQKGSGTAQMSWGRNR